MRRKDREILDAGRVETIIKRAKYMHLGLFDEEFPYVVPLHYGYEMENGKLTFYIHCAAEGHKLQCLRNNDRVFVEIDVGEALIAADVPCGWSAAYESVMCKGRAVILQSPDEKCRALKCLMKTQTGKEYEFNDKMAEGVTVVRIDVESYTAKAREK